MKKFLTILFAGALMLTGCGNNGGGNKSKSSVNIQSITARKYEQKDNAKSARKNAVMVNAEEESYDNYVIIYQDEKDISLTVTLDNPKGEAIDALQISCDDPNAKILVDGEYKPMTVGGNARVINWAQEDPYEKTFYMQTTSVSDLNTVVIEDIKVNGSWQGSSLKNNELEIYKITKDVFDTKFVTNTTEYYEVDFLSNTSISNLTVTCDHGEWINDTRYRVTDNCLLSWAFDYTFGEGTSQVVRGWGDSMDVELFSYTVINELFPVTVFLDANKIWLGNIEFSGSNVNDNLYLNVNNMIFKLEYIPENSLYKYNSDSRELTELSETANLYILNTLVLENIICE